MRNRAVITTSTRANVAESDELGVYLHWNGGKDSVNGFLTYCYLKGYPSPEKDNYGWARLCQVIGNFFGGSYSVGIDKCCRLDCDNGDNGVYIIKDWKIIGRAYNDELEQNEHSLEDMLESIDDAMPENERLGSETIKEYLDSLKS